VSAASPSAATATAPCAACSAATGAAPRSSSSSTGCRRRRSAARGAHDRVAPPADGAATRRECTSGRRCAIMRRTWRQRAKARRCFVKTSAVTSRISQAGARADDQNHFSSGVDAYCTGICLVNKQRNAGSDQWIAASVRPFARPCLRLQPCNCTEADLQSCAIAGLCLLLSRFAEHGGLEAELSPGDLNHSKVPTAKFICCAAG